MTRWATDSTFGITIAVVMVSVAFVVGVLYWHGRRAEKCRERGGAYLWREGACVAGPPVQP